MDTLVFAYQNPPKMLEDDHDDNNHTNAVASVTPDTTVIAFGVAASFAAQEEARAANIPIEYYNIVYDAIDSVESRMQEVLSPTPDPNQ